MLPQLTSPEPQQKGVPARLHRCALQPLRRRLPRGHDPPVLEGMTRDTRQGPPRHQRAGHRYAQPPRGPRVHRFGEAEARVCQGPQASGTLTSDKMRLALRIVAANGYRSIVLGALGAVCLRIRQKRWRTAGGKCKPALTVVAFIY